MWVSREMDEKKNVKICFAASSGGHYEQLMMLKPLMEKYDSFVITEKTDYSAEAKGEKTYYMKQVNRREKDFIWRMIQNAWKSIGIYRKEKPDVVICTGVLAMIPICFDEDFQDAVKEYFAEKNPAFQKEAQAVPVAEESRMDNSDVPVYYESFSYAAENGEVDLYRISRQLNPTKIVSYSSMLSRLTAMAGRKSGLLISIVLRDFLSIQFRSAFV